MNSKIKIPSNRNFGIVFFVIFLIIAIYPLIYEGDIRIWSLIISIIFLILGLLDSRILTPFNRIWFKFGVLLGNIVAPIVMGVIFYLVVTPIGIIMRIIKKDILNLKFNSEKTYWIKRDKIKSKMKNQF